MEKDDFIILDERFSFRIKDLINKGTYGNIYLGKNENTKEMVIIKQEIRENQLQNEFNILSDLQGIKGIPAVYAFLSHNNTNYMIMEKLELDLLTISEKLEFSFPFNSAMIIIIQMLNIIKAIHGKGYIHRDIKPDNFCINSNGESIKIIDFGFSTKYRVDNGHIPFAERTKFIGNYTFASINAMNLHSVSRRDDLESMMYILAFLVNGILPWQCLPCKTKKERFLKVKQIKERTSEEQLFVMKPQEFVTVLKYCKGLKYEEEPNYEYIFKCFESVCKRYDIDLNLNLAWDNSSIFHIKNL